MSFDNPADGSTRLDPPTGDSQVPRQSYRVRIGLAECTVFCYTEREAVRLARVKIGQQVPQVRSLMFNILDREFRVDLVVPEPVLAKDVLAKDVLAKDVLAKDKGPSQKPA